MKKITRKISGIILVFIAILIWAVCSYDKNMISMQTSAGIVSGTKIGWGVKRVEDHKQPDLGKTNVELMKKYERNIHGK